ncbi:hypothetical protein ABVD32_18820 [Xanthomonas euvesicatoria]
MSTKALHSGHGPHWLGAARGGGGGGGGGGGAGAGGGGGRGYVVRFRG